MTSASRFGDRGILGCTPLDAVSGFIGGLASVVGSHPFDTVKCRVQTQGSGGIPVLYKNGIDCFSKILRQEGALALYKGVIPPLLMQGVMNGIVFGVEKTTARFVRPRIHDSNVVRREIKVGFSCGLAAGFVQSFVCAPVELVKIRTQHQGIGKHKAHYKGNWATLTEIYRMGGVRGCYQGLWVTVLRDTPAFAVYFSSYEGQMSFIAKRKGVAKKDVGLLYSFFCGGITGTLTWVFNYPVDVVKSRFQMDGADSKPREYRNARDCFVKMWREGGVKLLYRGLSPCLVRAFANSSFLFVAVELSSNALQSIF